jgi:hypothetical protein
MPPPMSVQSASPVARLESRFLAGPCFGQDRGCGLKRTLAIAVTLGAIDCATASPPPPEESAAPPHAEIPIAENTGPTAVEGVKLATDSPVIRGELPWWHATKDGIYRFDGSIVVLAIGDSTNHQHIQEGFLHAKVSARLAVRKASESIRFKGAIPEPQLEDLFITRERRFMALYLIRLPKDAELRGPVPELAAPDMFKLSGRRRIGRHIFEKERHLFLECDVEGPIANPDWGRTRAAARG